MPWKALFIAALLTTACKKQAPVPAAAAVDAAPAAVAVVADAGLLPAVKAVPPKVIDWKQAAYERYVNPRFGFTLDVPKEMVPEPPTTIGDGRTFLGGGVELLAWAFHDVGTMKESCPKEPGATTFQIDKKSCWQTGIKDGRIFWQRMKAVQGICYALRFDYPEALKADMDPVVKRANDSWTNPTDGTDRGVPDESNE